MGPEMDTDSAVSHWGKNIVSTSRLRNQKKLVKAKHLTGSIFPATYCLIFRAWVTFVALSR